MWVTCNGYACIFAVAIFDCSIIMKQEAVFGEWFCDLEYIWLRWSRWNCSYWVQSLSKVLLKTSESVFYSWYVRRWTHFGSITKLKSGFRTIWKCTYSVNWHGQTHIWTHEMLMFETNTFLKVRVVCQMQMMCANEIEMKQVMWYANLHQCVVRKKCRYKSDLRKIRCGL